MAQQPRFELRVRLVDQTALIEVGNVLPNEVVEAADRTVAGTHPVQADLACGETALDQALVETQNVRDERSGLAALCPTALMQGDELVEESPGFDGRRRNFVRERSAFS